MTSAGFPCRLYATAGGIDCSKSNCISFLDSSKRMRSLDYRKTVWRYRGENTEAALTTDDPLRAWAFLTGYAAVALGAGAIPAWRASRIEPMRALHYE